MARYIDAEALKMQIEETPAIRGWTNMLLLIGEWIEVAQTADVAPMVHARWEYDERCGDYFCTECGRRTLDRHDEINEFDGATVIALTLPHYCGYCGAIMDGGEA